MDTTLFHEANWTYQGIKQIEERIEFWYNLKDEKQKKFGNSMLSDDLSNKLDNVISEIIKEHEKEIKRLYKIIDDL